MRSGHTVCEQDFGCILLDSLGQAVDLLLRNLERTRHHLFRAVPVAFQLEEILSRLLASLVALEHTQFLGHVDGDFGIVYGAFYFAVALESNLLIFEQVEIAPFRKAIFAHTRKPVLVRRFHLQELMQLSCRYSRLVGVVVYLDNIVHRQSFP